MKRITLTDVSGNFGCDVADFSKCFVDFYNTLDTNYEDIVGEDYDNLIYGGLSPNCVETNQEGRIAWI